MTFQLRKADRKKAKLRVGLFGPPGAGKTYSALLLASGIASSWDKIAVIDTENKSADLYADLGPYNVITLEAPFHPERYVEAIQACEQEGMEVIIVDSISHEWEGKGGCLELHDAMVGNSYTNWAKITPRHNRFIDAIVQSKCHMICNGRTKNDVVITEKNGKQVPEKIGLKAATREGFDYEMTVSFDVNIKHLATTTKDRTRVFRDKPEFVITPAEGKALVEWVMTGSDETVATPITREQVDRLNEIIKQLDADPAEVNRFIIKVKKVGMYELTQEQAVSIIKLFEEKLRQKEQEKTGGDQQGETPKNETIAAQEEQAEVEPTYEPTEEEKKLDEALGRTEAPAPQTPPAAAKTKPTAPKIPLKKKPETEAARQMLEGMGRVKSPDEF